MTKLTRLIPVSDLRKDAAAVLRLLRDSKEPLVITQRGRAAAVMLSLEAFELSEHQKQLLQLLALGEKEIAKGEGYSLDEVMDDAESLLKRGGL